MIPALRDVIEVLPFELRPVRLAEQNVPDPELPAGKIGQSGEAVDQRRAAVIVDRYEARPHERRLG